MNRLPTALFFSPLAASLLFTASAGAQQFDKTVIARGLASPTGIAVDPSGAVYVTEVPTPGMGGGANRVARLMPDGSLVTVSMGEPEPVNVTADGSGNLYWTCRTAGVIRRRDRSGSVRTWRTALHAPTGVSAPVGSARVYYTQVPTPGVPGSRGGMNSVDYVLTMTGQAVNLSGGEPEPVDVVADALDNVYWTCRTAGVILRYDARSSTVSKLLTGLHRPTGIALDAIGNLYFTEVPSPGIGGADNKVWKFDLARSSLTLVSIGEPEPVDIAVTADGQRVYWTCRSAGVVIMAMPGAEQPMVDGASTVAPGRSAVFALHATGAGGAMYFAASSLGLGPIDVAGRNLSLDPDPLFFATLGGTTPIATGYMGRLDPNGTAAALLAIPAIHELSGLQIHTAFGVFDPTAPMGIGALSDTHVARIE